MPKLCISDFRTLSDNWGLSAKPLHDNEHFPIALLAFRQSFVNTAAMWEKYDISGVPCRWTFQKMYFLRYLHSIQMLYIVRFFFARICMHTRKKKAIIDYINKATLMVT